jgi:hypothetical protein
MTATLAAPALLAALRQLSDPAIEVFAAEWDGDFQRATSRPGWTAGHLATHVARDADRRADILERRRTGAVPVVDPASRFAEDPGYLRPGAVLLDDLLDAEERWQRELAAAISSAGELDPELEQLVAGRLAELVAHQTHAGVALAAFDPALVEAVLGSRAASLPDWTCPE